LESRCHSEELADERVWTVGEIAFERLEKGWWRFEGCFGILPAEFSNLEKKNTCRKIAFN
jgi:hypothetical protein